MYCFGKNVATMRLRTGETTAEQQVSYSSYLNFFFRNLVRNFDVYYKNKLYYEKVDFYLFLPIYILLFKNLIQYVSNDHF